MKKLLITLAAAATLFAAGLDMHAQTAEQIAAFEKDLQEFREDIKNVGMSVVFVKNNHIAYRNSFGVKNMETGEKVDEYTLFRIASISKSFSATSMMQLIDQGKVSLNTDVSKLAGFKVRNPKYPNKVITLEMLLSHTSSINDSEGYFTLDVIDPATNPNWKNCYNDYEPGKGYEYCNLNYNMVGTFIEKLSGERFDQYVVKHVLRPLRLYGGYCVDSLDSKRFASLYAWDGEKFYEETEAYEPRSERIRNYKTGRDTPVFSPTGGMKISAPDLARYMMMHMNYGTDPNQIKVIPEKLSKEMQRPRSSDENYGLALWQTDAYSPGVTLTGHTGGAYGLRSAMFFNPEEKYGFVVISNGALEYASDGKTNVLDGAVSLMYKHFVKNAPKEPETIPIIQPKREFRGAWIHIVGDTKMRNMTTDQIKSWFTSTLDILKDTGCNAVVFQVRPQADAFYESSLEPWTRFLTGEQGKAPDPYWDPLQFMVEECHARGMELHAWLNPYRVTSNDTEELCKDHMYYKKPELFLKYGKQLYLNPAEPEARAHTVKVIADIVKRYDVDAIHFDDYFYPYPIAGEEFPDEASFRKYGPAMGYSAGQKADWRRENVEILIKDINTTIKGIKPWIRFGISPFGIHRNVADTPDGTGSRTNGLSNYDQLYADVPGWAEKGYIDYITPQIYWKIGHRLADYDELIHWWNDGNFGGHLYVGQSISTFSEPDLDNPKVNQMGRKMQQVRDLPNVHGNTWWPGWSIEKNDGGFADLLKRYQSIPALIPAYSHIDDIAPAPVRNVALNGRNLTWTPAYTDDPMQKAAWYVVYKFAKGAKVNIEDNSAIVSVTKEPKLALSGDDKWCTFAITAVDHCWNESAPSVFTLGDGVYSIVTNPGENVAKQMRVSWASEQKGTYVKYTPAVDFDWSMAKIAKPEYEELCTAYDSLYSKDAYNNNFYEYARFIKCGATLDGLAPDTEYRYVICSENGKVLSEVHRFKTAGANKWSACIISDFHSYPPLPKRLESAMKMVRTIEEKDGSMDWILHLGDVTAWGGSWSFWKKLYDEPYFSKYLWAGLNGNHDNMVRTNAQSSDFFRYANYVPGNGYEGQEGVCYHFRYGNAMFVMLNNEDMRSDEGFRKAQAWVKKVVTDAKAKADAPDFVIVCEHYQWFYGESGKTSHYAKWKDLFEEIGVDLALSGNNHIYVRSKEIGGVTYLQTASSDNERGQEMEPSLTDNQDIIEYRWTEGGKTISALDLKAAGRKLTLSLYDRDGNKLDSVTIKK